MKIFGCFAYIHVSNDERLKLDPKFKRCIFLGYKKGVKGYKLWDPEAKKVVINRDVVFDESSMLKTVRDNQKSEAEDTSNDDQVIQVEMDSSDMENIQPQNDLDQQHQSIATTCPNTILNHQ